MPISEEAVTKVVADVSERMKDPNYAQVAVGHFVQAHPAISQYLSAKMTSLGGGEAVIHAVFHAELLAEAFRRDLGRDILPSVEFPDLDATAGANALDRLAEAEPSLAGYLSANVDDEALREVVAHVGLALARTSRG